MKKYDFMYSLNLSLKTVDFLCKTSEAASVSCALTATKVDAPMHRDVGIKYGRSCSERAGAVTRNAIAGNFDRHRMQDLISHIDFMLNVPIFTLDPLAIQLQPNAEMLSELRCEIMSCIGMMPSAQLASFQIDSQKPKYALR